jgi:succinyl-CoA synthetase beta subunit
MAIEEVAHKNPEKIFKIPVDLTKELDIEPLLEAAKNLGIEDHKS